MVPWSTHADRQRLRPCPVREPRSGQPDRTAAGGGDFPKAGLGIDVAAAIERLGDDVELYLDLVQGFVETQATVPDELADLLAAHHWSDAERVAHTARSLAATEGATSWRHARV